jgi:membrane-associated phospholipid phosphatase
MSYMIATAPLALRAGAWVALATHCLGAAAILLLKNHGSRRWLPIVIAPLLYFTLPDLMAGWAGGEVSYRDPLVIRWERWLFGGDPAREMYRSVGSCLVSEPLHLGYLSYYALIFTPPLLLWRLGDREGVERTALALSLAFVASYVVFIAFPVQGPRYLWPGPEGMCDGPVRELVLLVLDRGSSRGAAFPSSHVAVAVAQALMMTLRRLPAVWVLWILSATLTVGAVYGGFHYAVDALAGVVVGAAAAWVAHSRRIVAIRSPAAS